MPAIWAEESFYAKEMKRWDAPKREGGMNRNGYEPFPRMLYKPQPHPMSGKYEVAIAEDIISLDKTRVILDSQAFNASCQMIVGNEEEFDRAKRNGWRETQTEAMEHHEGELSRLATEAAHRNHDDRNMSEPAKAEAQLVEDSTASHVAEIKEKRRAAMAKARAAKAAKKAQTV